MLSLVKAHSHAAQRCAACVLSPAYAGGETGGAYVQTQYIQIGEIVKPQGIRGEVKLRAMTSDMTRYARLRTVYLLEDGAYRPRKVMGGRASGGFAYLLLEGVADRNQAEALRGRAVYVDREHAIELGEDENFVCDLVGLTAVTGDGKILGTLTDVLTPNSVCDVYVFDTPRGEMMMPALRRVVREVDVEGGRIVLDKAALSEVAVWQDESVPLDE